MIVNSKNQYSPIENLKIKKNNTSITHDLSTHSGSSLSEESSGYFDLDDEYELNISPRIKTKIFESDKKIRCKTISNGGFGTVLKAHTIDNINYNLAIKVNRLLHDEDRKFVIGENIYAEKHILDPHLANVLYCDKQSKVVIMEYYNESLKKMFLDEKKNGITIINRKKVILDVLNATKKLHDNNLIHNDIKLPNVLYRKLPNNEETYVLCDFGLIQDITVDKEAQNFGTRIYMAPEKINYVLSDKYKLTKKSDVWSIGMLLFTLVATEEKGLLSSLLIVDAMIKDKRSFNDSFDDAQKYLEHIIDKYTSKQYEDYKPLIKNMLKILPSERISIESSIEYIENNIHDNIKQENTNQKTIII